MKRSTLAFLLVILVCVTTTATLVYYFNKDVVQTLNVPMDVKVADNYAFNLDSDAVHFGKVVPGNDGIRGFNLTSTFTFPISAELRFSGPLSKWVSATENNIILPPSTTHAINLTVSIPEGTPFGHYFGTMHVVFRRLP